MKKVITGIIILNTLVMCQKSDIQKVKDHINTADSLVSSVQESINNLDSLSIKVDSVKIPQIVQEKEKLQKVFDDSKKSIDSLGQDIYQYKEQLSKKEVQKQLDSVKSKVKSKIGENVKEQVKVVYKDREQTKSTKKYNPIIKQVSADLSVDDLSLAKQYLKNSLSVYNGKIISENYQHHDMSSSAYIVAKVPLSQFDYFLEDIGRNFGNMTNKNVTISGEDFVEKQMCTVELSITENNVGQVGQKNVDAGFFQKASDAFSIGGKAVVGLFLFLLPFWPIFLLASIGYYFYNKKRKLKNDAKKNDNLGNTIEEQ